MVCLHLVYNHPRQLCSLAMDESVKINIYRTIPYAYRIPIVSRYVLSRSISRYHKRRIIIRQRMYHDTRGDVISTADNV